MNFPRLSINLKREFVYLGIALLILLIIITVTFLTTIRGVKGSPQTITIPDGVGRRGVAKQLAEAHLIRSQNAFLGVLYLTHRTIVAGTYTINPNENLFTMVKAFDNGTKPYVTITIPEGWRREQIAALLTQKGLDGSTFLQLTVNKEGYLFPDTYFVDPKANIQTLVDKMATDFTQRTQALTPTVDQVKLASIVEREAKTDDQRAIIAAIYLNRLQVGMKLQADPTVQYGRDMNLIIAGTPPTTYWSSITSADYTSVDSPYNTYLHLGLPPTPIANPGVKSLEAAVHPATTDALYFFNAKDGTLITSRTLEEHIQKQRQYL